MRVLKGSALSGEEKGLVEEAGDAVQFNDVLDVLLLPQAQQRELELAVLGDLRLELAFEAAAATVEDGREENLCTETNVERLSAPNVLLEFRRETDAS